MRVYAVIPAYNEAETIAATVACLQAQTRRVDRVVVVANNCTDSTARVAFEAGAEVMVMTDNPHKKAGALNWALEQLMPELLMTDGVLVMDADTVIDDDFVEIAVRELEESFAVGGISSIFYGRDSSSLLGNLQRMEYFRQRREIFRHGDEAFVMSGTASLFRVFALETVKAARREGQFLPVGGSYYDVYSLTEDNELTFALKTLGFACLAPGVSSETDVMETSTKLVSQRRRWYLGALRNLTQYGLKLPPQLRWLYWRQQAGIFLSLMVVTMMWLSTATWGFSLVFTDLPYHFAWYWLIPSVVMFAERVMTVWQMGWKERGIAALLLPEILYSYVLLFSFALAAKDWVRGHKGTWQAT